MLTTFTGWRGDMTINQINMLRQKHAIFTPQGWVIPQWVLSLEKKILRWEAVQQYSDFDNRR